jgi:hypothetical protein
MLDSLLTLTKSGAAWLVVTAVVCVAVDRALSAMMGLVASLFLLGAIAAIAALVVSGIYTAGKWVVQRFTGADQS